MWKIERDYLAEEGDESRVGYHEEHSRIPASMVAIGNQSQPLPNMDSVVEGQMLPLIRFRLKDDDGEVYYEGILHDDDDCENQEAALAFGANDAGACIIEVARHGKWVQEIG